MNKQNAQICGTDNPQTVEQVQMRVKIFRCAIHNSKMIGPYFFRQYSVDNSAYKSML